MKTKNRMALPTGLFALLLAGFIATQAMAQDVTGSIVGLVRDGNGGAVAGATVTIKDMDKNVIARTVMTGSGGAYSAPLLPVGRYEVSIEARNFKKFNRSGIELNVNDRLTVDATLEVGQVTEVVTVETSPLEVELQTATQTGLISGREVRELPLNNRNYLQLITLMPGVSSGASDQLYIGTTNPSGQANTVQFAINGGRTSQNSYTVDGADNVDRGSNLTLLNYPSVDAIAEFKVLRNHYSAEYGRDAAGHINVVTKTGGGQFHGSAYEFFRNDVLNANSFFQNASATAAKDGEGKAIRPPLRYNNFGYTIGGPILLPRAVFGPWANEKSKKKLFFFFSQEFRRVNTSSNFIATAPTAGERQGIFSVPVCLAGTGTTCTQVLPAGTPIAAINPVASAYIKDIYSKIPLPIAGTNTLNSAVRNIYNYRQELLRVDYNFSEKLTFVFRFLNDTIPTEEPGGLFTNNQLPGVATTRTDSPGRNWLLRSVQTISPTLFNEAGFASSYGAIISRNVGLNRRINSPDITPILPFATTLDRVPNINPGYTGVSGYGPYDDFNRNYNVYDNVTKTLGSQTLKFGVNFHRYQKTENSATNNVGTFNFATTPRATYTDPVTGQTVMTPVNTQQWANFLLGSVSSFTQDSLDFTPDVRANQIEFYAQDDYRFRPNLTVNFGVRYSLFRQPTDASGNLSNFNPNFYDPAKAFQIAANGNRVPGTGDPLNGIIVGGLNSPFGDKVAPESNKNFAPVIGFAWDPFKDGRTAIRGGYGISYDTTLFGIVEQNVFTNPPLVSSVNISNTRLDNPGAGMANATAALNLRGIPFDPHTPYIQQWSLDAQREVLRGLILDIGYFGSKGTHLLGIVDLNQVAPGAAVAAGLIGPNDQVTAATVPGLNAVRPYRGYVAINAPQNWFNSNYHALQLAIEKRLAAGSQIKVSYTWSRNMTDNQSDRGAAPQSVYNFKADYGPAAFDRRQVLTVSYIYELPFFRQQQGLIGHVLGGWQLSGITTYASGVPLTVTTTGVDPSALGFTSSSVALPRPDLIADPNSNAPRTIGQWFNTGAFVEVPLGVTRLGNAGRGVVQGPGFGRWDLSLARNIRITEGIKAQFRAEMFNMFNHTNPLAVNTVRTSALFGQVTSTRDPRLIQLALKLYF
jgi:hypothetical protein